MPPANVGTGTDPDPNAKTPFEALFDYVGTNDDTPYLCTPAVLHFREVVCGGEQRIIDYIENLAWDAGNLVAKILGTEVLCEPGIAAQTERGASQLRRCAMVNVRLPIGVDDGTDETRQVHAKKVAEAKDNPDKTGEYPVVDVKSAEPLARWIEKELALKHNTMAVTFPLGPWMYMRMCAQIYLELEDFEWLANVMKGICKQVQHGEGPGGSELASEIEILEI